MAVQAARRAGIDAARESDVAPRVAEAHDDPRARMLAGLPLHEARLSINGIDTRVLRGGHGPPLLLLHGGIECGGAYWAPVVATLAERHRLIIPDVPGFGESAPVPRFDAATFDDWFSALLAATCDQRPVVVAHSLMGSFAARFATTRGASLARLVIGAAPGIGPFRMPLGLLIRAIRFNLRPNAHNKRRFEEFALLDRDRTRRRDPAWFDAFSRYSLSRAWVPHVKRAMNQALKVGTREIPTIELQRIPVPTSLIWGRGDRMVQLALAHGAHARLGWSLHLIDEAAHVPHMEQPAAFVATVEACIQAG